MGLELIVSTDLGEPGKKIIVDSSIRGSSDSDSNFKALFREYNLNGDRILGTKAVIINTDKFYDYLSKEYKIDQSELKEHLTSALKELTSNGYFTTFWDNTNLVHHRDMMRFCFDEISKSLNNYYTKVFEEAINNESNTNLLEKAELIETAKRDLDIAIKELYETKFVGTKDSNILNKMAKEILKLSQGYQLSSINANEAERSWESKIISFDMDSGITSDQQNYGITLDSQENTSNVNQFLSSLIALEINANIIRIPQTHTLDRTKFTLKTQKTIQRGNYYTRVSEKEKDISVAYTN